MVDFFSISYPQWLKISWNGWEVQDDMYNLNFLVMNHRKVSFFRWIASLTHEYIIHAWN